MKQIMKILTLKFTVNSVLTDFSYPNHCGLVKDMVYLKYIFVKMYKNKNKL